MTKRKKKSCVICGKRIRTGWKYCHEHRNTKKENNTIEGSFILFIIIGIIVIALIVNQLNKISYNIPSEFWLIVGMVVGSFIYIFNKKSKTNKEIKKNG